MSFQTYRRSTTSFALAQARVADSDTCSTSSIDFSTGTGPRCPWLSFFPSAPRSASGCVARLLCEAAIRLRRKPTSGKNAESQQMTMETEQLPDIDELRQEIDPLDAVILAADK